MARISRARVRGRSRATRSASRPTRSSRLGGASPISFSRVLSTVLFRDFPSDVGQQSDPQSDRPAGAACWPPSPIPDWVAGWSRGAGSMVRRRRRASAARYGVDFDTTPIETALNWGALALARATGGSERSAEKGRRYLNGAYFPRARARAEPSDALRQQTDPLEPAGRRFANLRQ